MPGLRPIVEGIDTVLMLNESIAASELFTVSDPDGDPITEYVFTDGGNPSSGFFIFQGIVQNNGATLTIQANQLNQLVYVAGALPRNETIRISASDGTLLSEPGLLTAYTAREESVRPVALVEDFTVLGNESVLASSFISGFDPDGFPITSYRIRDELEDQSFFSLDGEAVEQGVFRNYSADEFERLVYNGVGRRSEEIEVLVFDGTVNSLAVTAVANVRANLNRPVVDFASDITQEGLLTPIAPLVNFSDADGNTIKTIELRDRNNRFFSGSLVFQGEDLAPREFHSFTPEELENVFFRGGERNITEQVRYRVTDGRFRSGLTTIALENVADSGGGGGENAGVPSLDAVNFGENVQEQLFFIPIDSLVTQNNIGFPATSYEVLDTNVDPESANLFLNGNMLEAGVIQTFTDAEYENLLQIRTGVFEQRHFDEIYVRANNGTFQSSWTRLNVNTEPEFFEAFTGLDPNGFTVATWDDFINPTEEGRFEITFSFMQQLPDYNIGDVIEENPFRNPTPRLFFQFTEAQRFATRQALEFIETFANVEFVEVVDSPLTIDPVSGNRGGTLRFGNYYRAADPVIGGIQGADNSITCAQTFGPSNLPEGGDVWFNVEAGQVLSNAMGPILDPDGNLQFAPSPCGLAGLDHLNSPDVGPGTAEFSLLLDSVAFALGQRDPSDLIGPIDQNPILPAPTDTQSFTVQGNGFPLPGFFEQITGFQLYDVSFFQEIYGANNDFNTGNDTYSVASLVQGGNAIQALWDAAGDDTLSAVGSTISNPVVDLRPGFFSSIGNLEQNISIAFGAEIENATGSDNDDLLIGNELNNTFFGGVGADTIQGNGGDDLLTGGSNGDTFIFTVGDGNDVIDEMQLAGRDTIQLVELADLDSFEEDLEFRLDGRDLVIELTLDGAAVADSTITIRDQTRGAFRIETLNIGTETVDLVNLTAQATGSNQSFRLSEETTVFGNLVVPT